MMKGDCSISRYCAENIAHFLFRETFAELGPAGKIRTVSWQIEQIVDELPLFLFKLEEFSNLLDERLDFGTFKFCFVTISTFVVSTMQLVV